jgi:hypothetical protein
VLAVLPVAEVIFSLTDTDSAPLVATEAGAEEESVVEEGATNVED